MLGSLIHELREENNKNSVNDGVLSIEVKSALNY
jgi:hypothetical protein